MPAKRYFSYTRVSTAKQGHTGTSLEEQRSAIERYARKNGLQIIREFRELETAARRGRPIFRQMMRALQEGMAAGLVMHKIDRGARNLKDWAEIGDLIDLGVEVHFANENLDMYTRGGRLSADIQAVVAADYIRNLKEEVKKGMYGRIKQGLYPMPAPLGYLDQGGGVPKIPDPAKAPLIREIFELYATRRFSLKSIVKYAYTMGLRYKNGLPLSINGMSHLLNNHFYTGIIRIKAIDEFYPGKHEPIVSKNLFDRVHEALKSNRSPSRPKGKLKEMFLYRRFLNCVACGSKMYAEFQKNIKYYRCHTKGCVQKTIREDAIQAAFMEILIRLKFDRFKTDLYKNWILQRRNSVEQGISEKREELKSKIAEIRQVLSELSDAVGSFISDRPAFLKKKNKLIEDELRLREALHEVEYTEHAALIDQERAFDFGPRAYLTFRNASFERKRQVVEMIAESIEVEHDQIKINLRRSFENLLKI